MKDLTGIPSVKYPKWITWAPRLFIGFSIAALLAIAVIANAAGTTIPERHSAICSLFSAPPDCKIKNARGGVVTLIIGINDRAGSLLQSPIPPNYISTLTVKLPHSKYLQIPYQLTAWPEIPPCIFQSCVELGYSGPTETDLLLLEALEKVQFQYIEGDFADALRGAFNTTGIPYISKLLSATINDQTATLNSTTLTLRVQIKFAIGAE